MGLELGLGLLGLLLELLGLLGFAHNCCWFFGSVCVCKIDLCERMQFGGDFLVT